MKRIFAVLLAFCIAMQAGGALAADPLKEAAAVKAAEEWLAIVDAQRYDLSWKMASEYFKNAVTEEQWGQATKGVRNPLGGLDFRVKKEAVYQTTMSGAPDGEYVIVKFDASFQKKKSAVETVTLMLEGDGQWRVAGYFIK